MNYNLDKIYNTAISNEKHLKSVIAKIKSAEKIAPALLMVGAIPMASQAQILSNAGLICNTNQTPLIDLNRGTTNVLSSTSYLIGANNSLNFKSTYAIGYNPIDIDNDGITDFSTFFAQIKRSVSTVTSGAQLYQRFIGLNDVTAVSSVAAFEADLNNFSTPTFGGTFQTGYVNNLANETGCIGPTDTFFKGNFINLFTRLAFGTSQSLLGSTMSNPSLGTNNPNFTVGTPSTIGIQFDSGGNTHYGFMELVINNFGDATLLNTAYNPIPNQEACVSADACEAPEFIPTASEWGLITLALLLLSFGTTMIIKREGELASTHGNLSFNFGKPLFNSDLFKKSLIVALGFGLMLSVGSIILTGTLTLTDIIGGAIATPILAYWLHLIGMYKNEEI